MLQYLLRRRTFRGVMLKDPSQNMQYLPFFDFIHVIWFLSPEVLLQRLADPQAG